MHRSHVTWKVSGWDVCASASCGVGCDHVWDYFTFCAGVSGWSMTWFRSGCTASCGWHMCCIVVRGDAWPVLLSPCNTWKVQLGGNDRCRLTRFAVQSWMLWYNRHQTLQVLSHVSARLADMHEAGYVHRDVKPANVMWLPRENRWTVIDFGCAARIGESVALAFTLTYGAPEVVDAFETQQRRVEASPAVDAWALGVMAFELLTGAPAFQPLTHGCESVRQLLHALTIYMWDLSVEAANARFNM